MRIAGAAMKCAVSYITIALLSSTIVAGCASPKVVQEREAGDTSLNCTQLVAAIDDACEFENKARRERGATGTNVAAAVLFWPGLLATYSNTGDAITAAQDRQKYLTRLYDGKSCDKEVALTKASPENTPVAAAAVSAPPAGSFVVDSLSDAGAYSGQQAQGTPLYNFPNGTTLTVIEISADGRWQKVMIPDGRAAYVAAALVKTVPATPSGPK